MAREPTPHGDAIADGHRRRIDSAAGERVDIRGLESPHLFLAGIVENIHPETDMRIPPEDADYLPLKLSRRRSIIEDGD